MQRRSSEEKWNALTHLVGVVFTLGVSWLLIKLGYEANWRYAFGVTFFTVGMLMMYTCSTLYHWWAGKKGKKVMRILDHISIYVMIAASYTPVCIGVLGGWIGWTVFGILWAIVIGGTFYKIFAIDRLPSLSLILYLIMGWSVVFIAYPVYQNIDKWPLLCIVAEGLFYTGGTYFFAHDQHRFFHAIWHIFVLLGSMAHWTAILLILLEL